jgi:ubiquinone/menaquinone biosynthesis C-methylase UbiE
MPQFHPESADLRPDELARLRFLADFRKHLHIRLGKTNRSIYRERHARPEDRSRRDEVYAAPRRAEIRARLEADPFFQAWSALLRSSQDFLWHHAGSAVDADTERLEARYRSLGNRARGSVTLAPNLNLPAYITDADTHRMPGSYQCDRDPVDVRAGALYDIGGVIYQLGIGNSKGRMLNDSRGRTVVAHLRQRFPRLEPRRIVDLGCGVGHNTVPLAQAFPNAEVHGVDVGAALLRYAHLRSEGLEVAIHYRQQDAEHTDFEDDAFDLVVSQIVFHETSPEAVKNIIAESYRIVRPGGVVVHLEVPVRYEHLEIIEQFLLSWEQYYNVEPNIEGVGTADFYSLMTKAGFTDVECGFQAIPEPGPHPKPTTWTDRPPAGLGATWFVVSGTKPRD